MNNQELKNINVKLITRLEALENKVGISSGG